MLYAWTLKAGGFVKDNKCPIGN